MHRIAIFAPEIHEPFIEGIQKSAWHISGEFFRKGNDVNIFTQITFGSKIDSKNNVKVFYWLNSCKVKILKYAIWLFDSIRICVKIKRLKIDKIFVFSLDLPFILPLLFLCLFNRSVKIKVLIFSFREIYGINGLCLRLIKRKIEAFFVRSDLAKDRLSVIGVESGRIKVLLPFLNKSDFFVDNKKIDSRLDNKLNVAYLSSADFGAGLEDIISVAKNNPMVNFKIAIRKFSKEKELEVSRFFDEHNVGSISNIEILRNIKNIPDFLSGINVVILPPKDFFSSMDMPMVMIESFAKKVTVVCSDIEIFHYLESIGCVTIFKNADHLSSIIKEIFDGSSKSTVVRAFDFVLELPELTEASELYLK